MKDREDFSPKIGFGDKGQHILNYQESDETLSTANCSVKSSGKIYNISSSDQNSGILSSEQISNTDSDTTTSADKSQQKKRFALRAARQAILLRRSYQWRQGDDTKILATFCPSFLLKRLASKTTLIPQTFFGKGACLIADISGFVMLCGRLSALGVNGIDDLRQCTNSYIGDLVDTIYKRGGDGKCIIEY